MSNRQLYQFIYWLCRRRILAATYGQSHGLTYASIYRMCKNQQALAPAIYAKANRSAMASFAEDPLTYTLKRRLFNYRTY